MKKTLVNVSAIIFLLLSFIVSCTNNVSSEEVTTSIGSTPEETIRVSTKNSYSNPTYQLANGIKTPTYTADPFVVRDSDGT